MEKKNLNDKIFAPINRNEMNCIVGGKIVEKYVRRNYFHEYNMKTGETDYWTNDQYDVYDVDEWGNSKWVDTKFYNDPK